MRWRKLGHVYSPRAKHEWAVSHAMLPTPLLIAPDRLRVFFASVDQNMIGRIGYVDIDPMEPTRVLAESQRPVLDTGADGCFDEHGVNPASVIERNGELWLYYFGYQRGLKVPYLLLAGLAVSRDGGESFRRYSDVPILERSQDERFVRSAPFALGGAAGVDLWYVSGNAFRLLSGRLVPTYSIRHVESSDGVTWAARGKEVVPLADDGDEYGLGRPFVTRFTSGWRLWYSRRTVSRGYRIGLAESSDGVTFVRRDNDVGIDVSSDGWDADMICYASVITLSIGTLMLYNGNGYGRSGFGAAMLDN